MKISKITRLVIPRLLFSLLLVTLAIGASYATHNRAGEITYEQIGELTIRITITTYTKTSSLSADRDTLDVDWGDGTFSRAGRVNGFGDILPNDIKRNFYIAEHTYPGRATYTITTTDPNRIANILNVNAPNSINVPFHIETTFTFLGNQFQGSNSSAILLQPPIDFACLGQRFVHNANAYDPDGDSLAYELIVPLQTVGMEVPNYLFPDQITPGANNQLTLDEKTGDLVWDAPQRAGEYNVAFMIHEYRQGVLLNSIIRDMQILVESDCQENNPPEIEVPEEICVVAGEVIDIMVTATDPDDPPQQLSLTALGGPFEQMVSPATFQPDGSFRDQPIVGRFRWETQCEHIAEHAYSVVFKAVDDIRDTSGLATLKTLQIKVVGPPPENVIVSETAEGNTICWDKPYACEVTEDDYFKGFAVWRRPTSNKFPIDTCNPSLEGQGYTRIVSGVQEFDGNQYKFTDTDIDGEETYCYRVTGVFAQTSIAGYPFNLVYSLPSNEDCAGISLDQPFLTKVSVTETSSNNGVIEVEWTGANPAEFDTTVFPGPYQYVLARGDGLAPGTFVPVDGAVFTSNTFGGLTDTSFTDQTGLNTQDQPYSYQVWLYANGNFDNPVRTSPPASSVFLTVTGGDNQSTLTWETNVPWQNYSFRIFRQLPASTDFEQIGTTTDLVFVDPGLENGVEYCYYIETEGAYGFSTLPEPLFNDSQISCDRPSDTSPPCVPVLDVQNSCDDNTTTPDGAFVNRLSWSLPQSCEDPMDVEGYRIYFSPMIGTPFELIAEIDDPSITTYEDGSDAGIAGCYTVTSLDSLGNESDTSNIVCVDNCPFYALPNTFTPNMDGSNDVFKPYPYKFIDHIELKIFNRWGQLVFETVDPDINWNGQNAQGNDLSQGVYHYICHVYEASADPENASVEVLQGFIELIR